MFLKNVSNVPPTILRSLITQEIILDILITVRTSNLGYIIADVLSRVGNEQAYPHYKN
jgi:hypothetical protein